MQFNWIFQFYRFIWASCFMFTFIRWNHVRLLLFHYDQIFWLKILKSRHYVQYWNLELFKRITVINNWTNYRFNRILFNFFVWNHFMAIHFTYTNLFHSIIIKQTTTEKKKRTENLMIKSVVKKISIANGWEEKKKHEN